MKFEKNVLLLVLLSVIALITAQEGPPTTEGPTTVPTTLPKVKQYCCNKCPPPKVDVKVEYKMHTFTYYVPYPVFKPLPTSVLTKCPPKFKKVSKRKCVHYVKSKRGCPPGYFRVSDVSCLKVVVLPPRHPHFKVKCPKGYKKHGELGCVIGEEHKKKFPKLPKIVIPKLPNTKVELPKPKEELKCPKGYIKKGKYHCVKVMNCPKGYRKNKAGYCIRNKVKCPKGYTRLGRQCIKGLTSCPRGYKYIAKEHCCVKGKKKIYKQNKCATVKCAAPKCADGTRPYKPKGECCLKCKACKCVKKNAKFNPVCGADGVTYKNACTCRCLGQKVAKKGACRNTCPKTKTPCPKYYRPVCGADGVTYSNICSCNLGGVKVKHVGVCKKEKCP